MKHISIVSPYNRVVNSRKDLSSPFRDSNPYENKMRLLRLEGVKFGKPPTRSVTAEDMMDCRFSNLLKGVA